MMVFMTFLNLLIDLGSMVGKIKKIVMMMRFNIEIWNVRGLNAEGKITAVSDALKKSYPDIIALSENKEGGL
jgi:hypothetical protein